MNAREKIKRNIASGIFYQVVTIILGIVIPRLVLVNLGSEANGLINSTNQALTYLALLEGGMGLSITQALYKPVAIDCHQEVNEIMSTANLFYRNVGKWYFLGVIFVSILYSYTLSTSIPRSVVFGVVLLSGLPQVINFFFQGKYRTLISVYGKEYALTNFNTVVYVVTSFLKIALLTNGFGLLEIQLMYFGVSLFQMAFILAYVKKTFPWIDLRVKPIPQKIGQRSSVFIHQIAGFIFSNTDILVLTYFCNLKIASVYSLYNLFYSMVATFVANITGGVVFKMGQMFQIDRKQYLHLQNTFETINMLLVFSCQFVLCLCILPFLKIYTRGLDDINYLDNLLPYLFATVHLLQSGRFSSQKVIEYGGEFKGTQWHAAVEMIVNLVVSLFGVIKFGIYGVLYGTIVALLVRSILMIWYACKKILHISQKAIYIKWGLNIIVFIVGQMIMRLVSVDLDSYLKIIIYACIMMIVSLFLFGGISYIYDKETWYLVTAKMKKRIQK